RSGHADPLVGKNPQQGCGSDRGSAQSARLDEPADSLLGRAGSDQWQSKRRGVSGDDGVLRGCD
nr:hypothetical protein [Tanacetum cinerariifolium]